MTKPVDIDKLVALLDRLLGGPPAERRVTVGPGCAETANSLLK